jgi:lipid II:glycine glycyltransferase (peptidoglycan interpeptide bridge formation enzyme)
MRNLDQKWRYNLRQAVKNNIEVQFGDSEGLPTFANLHSAMLSRKKLRSDDPIHLIPELSKRLPSDMRPKVVFAYHEGIAVAGAVIVVVDDLALYLWGASTEEALPLKAGYALQWKVACWLAERNCRWYDLGGGNRDPGIRQFKRGFVGREGSILELDGEFSLCQSIIALLATDAFYYSRNLQLATRRMCTRLARRAKFL